MWLLAAVDSIKVHAVPMGEHYEIFVKGVKRGQVIIYDERGVPVSTIPVIGGRAIKPCRLDLTGERYYYILIDDRDSVLSRGILK